MKNIARNLIVVIGLALLVPLKMALADHDYFKGCDGFGQLTAQWWQWALSIPTAVNPILDATGEDCMIGQSGSMWFLAGTFGGVPVTRTCGVPEGTELFFPVVNSVYFNSPNICGQGPEDFSVKFMRAYNAAFIDGATNVSAELDGRRIKPLHRVVSAVFPVALPEENIFDAPCAGDSPAGVFSPAVDGRHITRDVGIALIRCGEFKTVDEVVFAKPGDLKLLGARTLEGFNALVDPRRKRLVAAGPIPAA
jgi:hypothetical protein